MFPFKCVIHTFLKQVLRTDIIEDAGTSISPLVDIGQVEGSWVFGQGLFTTEGPKYDPATGAKLTNDTWVRNRFGILLKMVMQGQ